MRGKISKIITATIVAFSGAVAPCAQLLTPVEAKSCPELQIIFARGSGADYTNDKNYNEFRTTLETKLLTTGIDYEFINLEYPAIGVGVENLDVTLGAFFGGGDAYEFGESVKAGVKKLRQTVNSSECPETKYVLGGYSQGAMVVSKALGNLNAERVIFAATFGDPKLYLPEGAGIIPAACRGENLSDYRMYVPDCQAYTGLLGAYVPYEPESYVGKVGTWCNKADIFCSSHFNISDHVSYVEENLYEDAARVMFNKITDQFGVENTISSPHDTAILIDTTGSMSSMIKKYQDEAIRVMEKTLAAGGRVALYSYRDVAEQKRPIEHCNFESCTAETFKSELYGLRTTGGGDAKESLLSGAFYTMQSLEWKRGATKSLVVLTDNGFHSPDLDGITVMDVINLSRSIDPVALYVIGDPVFSSYYDEITGETGGRFISIGGDLSGLTDEIMERVDPLPQVETNEMPTVVPEVRISGVDNNAGEVKVIFESDAEKFIVVLNDYIIGMTSEKEITISEIQTGENTVQIVPIAGERRGNGAEVTFSSSIGGRGGVIDNYDALLVPNTGGR